jgi:hypothetical protein
MRLRSQPRSPATYLHSSLTSRGQLDAQRIGRLHASASRTIADVVGTERCSTDATSWPRSNCRRHVRLHTDMPADTLASPIMDAVLAAQRGSGSEACEHGMHTAQRGSTWGTLADGLWDSPRRGNMFDARRSRECGSLRGGGAASMKPRSGEWPLDDELGWLPETAGEDDAGAPEGIAVTGDTGPNQTRIYLVLFGMQNRTFGPYSAANDRILISLVNNECLTRFGAMTLLLGLWPCVCPWLSILQALVCTTHDSCRASDSIRHRRQPRGLHRLRAGAPQRFRMWRRGQQSPGFQ